MHSPSSVSRSAWNRQLTKKVYATFAFSNYYGKHEFSNENQVEASLKLTHWSILRQVNAKKEAENLDLTSAIDHVRVEKLTAQLGDAGSVLWFLLLHWNYEPQASPTKYSPVFQFGIR